LECISLDMQKNTKTITTTLDIIVIVSAIMVVSGLIVIPTSDNTNAFVSHDLVTKVKNFVEFKG
jgi:uncharacterized membrane protein